MSERKKRLIVIGGGFGGISFVKSLKNENVEIILIDKNNYHLFQPLLYQVAGTVLSPSDIAVPLRRIFRKQKNVKVSLDGFSWSGLGGSGLFGLVWVGLARTPVG